MLHVSDRQFDFVFIDLLTIIGFIIIVGKSVLILCVEEAFVGVFYLDMVWEMWERRACFGNGERSPLIFCSVFPMQLSHQHHKKGFSFMWL